MAINHQNPEFTHLKGPSKFEIFKKMWQKKDFTEIWLMIARFFFTLFIITGIITIIWLIASLFNMPSEPPYVSTEWKKFLLITLSILGLVVGCVIIAAGKHLFIFVIEYIIDDDWPRKNYE